MGFMTMFEELVTEMMTADLSLHRGLVGSAILCRPKTNGTPHGHVADAS